MYHYKDRDPGLTIRIIKDFFNSKPNFELIEKISYQNPESKTWWAIVQLKYKGYLYLEKYGKGISKLLSLASAYAELFEMYCSNSLIYTNQLLHSELHDNTKNLLHPYLINNLNELEKKYINLFDIKQNNNIEYKSIINETTIKGFSLPLLYEINGSTGLAAGNTLEEALISAISEIYERYVLGQLYQINMNTNLKFVQLNIIDNSIIDRIKQNNKRLFVYDLNYTFNLPVCLVILQDIISNKTWIKLGCHPIFNIALERCLTELYQLEYDAKSRNNDLIQLPFKELKDPIIEIAHNYQSENLSMYYPEYILLNTIYKDKESDQWITAQDYSNSKALLEIYLKHFPNDLYYYKTSPEDINDIYAVHVLCLNLNLHMHNNNYSEEIFKYNQLIYDIAFKIKNKENIKPELRLLNHYDTYLPILFHSDPFIPGQPYTTVRTHQIIHSIIKEYKIDNLQYYYYKNKIQQYYNLQSYMQTYNYNEDELHILGFNPKLIDNYGHTDVLYDLIFNELTEFLNKFNIYDFNFKE